MSAPKKPVLIDLEAPAKAQDRDRTPTPSPADAPPVPDDVPPQPQGQAMQTMARMAAQHVESAHLAAQQATPPSLLEPVTLERSIATAGKELGRADEDVRLLENVVDHAASSARQSAGIATEITDNARRRMAEQGRVQIPHQAAPSVGSPAR